MVEAVKGGAEAVRGVDAVGNRPREASGEGAGHGNGSSRRLSPMRQGAGFSGPAWVARRRVWAGVLLVLAAPAAGAATPPPRLELASPQGTVGTPVQQIRLRFDRPVVVAGDPRSADPVQLSCQGLPAPAAASPPAAGAAAPAGNGRWNGEREWVFDLLQPLPPGVRCEVQPRAEWTPLPAPAAGTPPSRPAAAARPSTAFAAFGFSTGGPVVTQIRPWAGSTIDEQQHFVLVFNGRPDAGSVLAAAHCAVQGVGDRLPVRQVEGAEREATLAAQGFARPGSGRAAEIAARSVVLACARPLPPEARVRLVVEPGVASAGQPALVARQGFSEGYAVRPAFTAEFSCERERAGAPCWPIRPLSLRFSAPLSRADAQQIRLVALDGRTPPRPPAPMPGDGATVQFVEFAPPLDERARYRVELPQPAGGLRDDAGRPLANADRFPLEVTTGEAPPIAKFAAAPFGILERGLAEPRAGRTSSGAAPAGVLPLTLRHVQSDWAAPGSAGPGGVRSGPGGGIGPASGVAASGTPAASGAAPVAPSPGVVRTLRVTDPAEVLAWLGRLQRFHEQSLSAREAGLPRGDWTRTEIETDANGRERPVQRERFVGTREVSLLRADSPVATGRTEPPPRRSARADAPPAPDLKTLYPPLPLRQVDRLALPPLPDAASAAAPRPFEVVGLPLAEPGYHVVEVESARLGAALLDPSAPMYVRTGVLVTNLGVHIKHGRASSAVWVTRLDRGRPVAGAEVTVHDCRGTPLWTGSTDAQGLAHIDRPLDPRPAAQRRALAEGRWDEAQSPAARCTADEGLFVFAREPATKNGAAGADFAFAFSSWQRGIEPWRFDLPTGDVNDRFTPEARAHTVLDRSLLRAGETVQMKHFLRLETPRGLALPDAASLPDGVVLTHVGSGQETRLPIDWQGARSATSSWSIPPGARLGQYAIALERRASPGAGSSPPGLSTEPAVTRWPSGDFRVEAFRVPLIEARLVPPARVPVGARALDFSVSVQHLSGGGMAQRQATVSALLTPTVPSFPGFDGFRFDPPRAVAAPGAPAERDDATGEDGEGVDGGDSGGQGPARVVADRVPAPTDRLGAGQVRLADLPAVTRPSLLMAELSVDDPNGERQSTAVTVPLWPSDRVLGLQAPAFGRSGEPIALQVLALDTAGRPQAAQAVTVQARLRQTTSVRKRLVGGFYSYDNRVETLALGTLCEGRTDASGRFACTPRLPRGGELEFVATTTDAQGRPAEAATRVWVSGSDDAWFAQDDDDRIVLQPERARYAPGETARIQVRMPFREATALVSIEREGVIDSRVTTLRADQPVIELPITGAWAPNVVVSVLVLRGRVREVPWMSFFDWGWRAPLQWWRARRDEAPDWKAPGALVDLARPSMKLGAVGLSVGTQEQTLEVAVSTPRADYRVRETAEARIRVTRGGQPLAEPQTVELAFAAIDEGLLALAPNPSWDLLGAMMRERPWSVATASGHSEIVGRRHYGRKAVAPGGGGGRGATRELFETALVWRARVTLDARGEATVPVPLNDSLTAFRLVAVADALGTDGRMAFGRGEARIRTTQELQLLPGLPLAVREGDRFDARVTVRNTTAEPMRLRVSMAAQAVPLGGAAMAGPAAGAAAGPAATSALVPPPPQSLDLAPGATQELAFPVQVPEGLSARAEALDWTLVAEEVDRAGAAPRIDRVRRRQAVLAAVPLRVWQSSVRALDGPIALEWAPPVGALSDAGVPRGGVQVALQASLAQPLPGVRRWFEAYPYTCLEQQASRSLGLLDRTRWDALVAAWPGHLDEDGLAAYFPVAAGSTAAGSDRLTAYLVSAAHEAGFALPAAVLDPMLAGLLAYVEGRVQRAASSLGGSGEALDRDVRRLAALEALSRHGRAEPRHLSVLRVAPGSWPTSALLDWIAVLQRLPPAPDRAARLTEARSALQTRLLASGTRLALATEASDAWWWLMEHPDANAARVLLAALDDPAMRDDLPRLVAGHLARQRDGAWATTTANVWGVLALRRFALREEQQAVDGRTVAAFGAARGERVWPTPAPAAGAPTPPAASPSSASAAGEASPTGGRDPAPLLLNWPAAAAAGGAAATVGSALPAASGPGSGSPAGPRLTVQHQGAGRPWLTLQSLAAVPITAPVVAGYRLRRTMAPVEVREAGRLSRGDVVQVTLEIEASEARTWVAVSDPLPPGATVLGSGLGGESQVAALRGASAAAGATGARGGGEAATIVPTWIERTPDHWRAYLAELPRGRHVLSYRMRLTNAGRFQLPPARAEAMYAPETFGELPIGAVQVQP